MTLQDHLWTLRRELDDDGLDRTWATLRELGVLLTTDLEPWRMPGSRWSDFMIEAPLRLVDLPLLLLEDLGVPADDERLALERSLLRASLTTTVAIFHAELSVGAEVRYGPEHTLLQSNLVAAATWQLATTSSNLPALARAAQAHWSEHGAALHDLRERRVGRVAAFSLDEIDTLGGRFAPLATVLVCAAQRAGRADVLPELLPLFARACSLFQLGRELSTIHQDLSRGHCTAPIALLLLGMGGLDEGRALEVDRAAAAIVLTRTLDELATHALARTQALRQHLRELGLIEVLNALDGLDGPFLTVRQLYAGAPGPATDPRRTTFPVSHRPQLEIILRAAQGFLSADPCYCEAVEEYRWGFLGQPELQAKVFPIGIILENRSEAGDDCAQEISALFETYAANRFHYFEQVSALPFDADSCALMLRLVDRAADPRRARALMQTPLAWLLANIAADGGVPVFMIDGVDAGDDRRYVSSYGTRCGVVQAAVILGLARYDGEAHEQLIERMLVRLHDMVEREGAGCFAYYDVPYASLQLFATCAAVREAGRWPQLENRLCGIEARMLEIARAQRGLGAPSAQTAALLWLASSFPAARSLRNLGWVERLLRTQRASGAWPSSPFFVLPTRGNLVEWFDSRLLSSSFAYRALRGFERDEGGAAQARWRSARG